MRRPWGIPEERAPTWEVLAPLLAISAVVAGDFPAMSTYFFSVDMPVNVSLAPAVSDGQRGVAAGTDISGSTIDTLPSPEAPRR